MDPQGIRLGVGRFDCEKVEKSFFFANAFSSMPQIALCQPAIKKFGRAKPLCMLAATRTKSGDFNYSCGEPGGVTSRFSRLLFTQK
jgi:hypothetical protein